MLRFKRSCGLPFTVFGHDVYSVARPFWAHCATLQDTRQTNMVPCALFSHCPLLWLHQPLVPSLPVFYSHFSNSTHKLHMSLQCRQTEECVYHWGRRMDIKWVTCRTGGGNDFFSSGVWLEFFLSLFFFFFYHVWREEMSAVCCGDVSEFPRSSTDKR